MIAHKKNIAATVIIPTYGNSPFSIWAIKSVCDQTIKNIEIFIVCDGSPLEMVNEFKKLSAVDSRIQIFEFTKAGRTGEPHRDYIIKKKAKGKYIFYCSHDDLWLQDHIDELIKSLKNKDFSHSIHVAINEHAQTEKPDKIFSVIYAVDLKNQIFQDRMLCEKPMMNYFGLTYAAHHRKSYLKLAEGWTITPKPTPTDLFMWRKFLRKFGMRCGTWHKITALNFPAPLRKEWSEEKRESELAHYYKKIQEKDFVESIRICTAHQCLKEYMPNRGETYPGYRITIMMIKILSKIINRIPFQLMILTVKMSGLFDSYYYSMRYPKVSKSFHSGLKHFLLTGGIAGYNPSPHFDSSHYLNQYPDVKHSGINPLLHYLIYGKSEGRNIQAL